MTSNPLVTALRQYSHNHGEGFVFGYDREETDRIVAGLVEDRNQQYDMKCKAREQRDKLVAMMSAAPEGVPVRFCEDTALSLAERTFSTEVDEQLAEDIIQYARRLHSRYTAPQPTPEVVEALEGLLAIVSESFGVAGYHLNGKQAKWSEFEEVEMAEEALAIYRQKRG